MRVAGAGQGCATTAALSGVQSPHRLYLLAPTPLTTMPPVMPDGGYMCGSQGT